MYSKYLSQCTVKARQFGNDSLDITGHKHYISSRRKGRYDFIRDYGKKGTSKSRIDAANRKRSLLPRTRVVKFNILENSCKNTLFLGHNTTLLLNKSDKRFGYY
jgi:hypothetical protein